MTILALYSNKGGVGKTAAAVNLAYLSARSGRSTLLCDLDVQGSATFYCRVEPQLRKKARGLAKGGKSVERSIKGSDYENLDLLPADFTHRNLDIAFDGLKRSKRRLDVVLAPLQEQYDLIVLDCPPSFNLLAENVINVSDILLVPLAPTTLSVRSYQQLLDFIDGQAGASRKPSVFFSMVDRRKKLHCELVQTLPTQYDGFLESEIPYLSAIEQMGVYREPVPEFAPHSRAANAYRALWQEIDVKLLNSST